MSTLRTNTLQTLDSSFTINVNELAASTALPPLNKSVNTQADLRNVSKLFNSFVTTLGATVIGDGGGIDYFYDSSDTVSADNGGSVIVATDGGRWKPIDLTKVTSRTFGAKGDKVTDDTVRLQAYINWCLSFTLAKPMVIAGMCLVSASLNIDRLVDSTVNEFRIVAANDDSGFLVGSTINLFDSTLPMPGVDPVSEAVTVENIRFEANVGGINGRIVTRKFLRMKFLNCYFYKIRFVSSDTYLQSFYFNNCNIRFWPGIWATASHVFDTHFVQCQSEFGNGYLTNFANGSYNLTFTDGLHEGTAGGLLAGGGFRQLKIDGYYLEGNTTPCLTLDAGAVNWSVSVTNSIFASTAPNVANSAFYDIVWGPTFNARAGGNYHTNGRLHDNSGLTAGGLLRGGRSDAATLALFKSPIAADGGTGNLTLTTTLGTGTQNYARFIRDGDFVKVEGSYTFVGTSGTPAAFNGLPLAPANAIIGGDVYYSDYTTTPIRIVGGTTFGTALQFRPASDIAGASITYTALNGKTIVFDFTYRV